jgi:prevent-host-death family protein
MTSLVRIGSIEVQSWQLQEAKARMSELVKQAQQAPQGITLHGKPVAVMVSQATFESLSRSAGSLLDFMQSSPLAGSDEPAFKRSRSRTRPTPNL